MLKKFKVSDIDKIMNLWKKEYFLNHKKMKNEELTQNYTIVKNKLLNKKSTTILYTEDDIIEGFISYDENNEIYLIYVDKAIRREGIGSMLVDACKKRCNELSAIADSNNEIINCFFQKNDFKLNENDNKSEYTWVKESQDKTCVVYFDNDINEALKKDNSSIDFKRIQLKDLIQDKEIKDVKTYLKIRKLIESVFKGKKVLLYINYNNYYAQVDDLIKEIIKISKTKFGVVISEPLVVENFKYGDRIKEIEQSYKSYKTYKIDTTSNIKENISVNKLLDEKMKVILTKIEEIAENM